MREEWEEVVKDTSMALDLLKSSDEDSKMSVGALPSRSSEEYKSWCVRCLARRATAYAAQKRYEEGEYRCIHTPLSFFGELRSFLPTAAADFETASKLEPDNLGLQKDRKKMQRRATKARKEAEDRKEAGGEEPTA